MANHLHKNYFYYCVLVVTQLVLHIWIMKLLYFAVKCIVTLFRGIYAQSPPLSPSFSFRATGVIIGDQTTVYDPFLFYNDADRGLLREEVTDTTPGQQINGNALISRIDNVTFATLDGTCTMIHSGLTFGVLSNADPWGSFTLLGTGGNVMFQVLLI